MNVVEGKVKGPGSSDSCNPLNLDLEVRQGGIQGSSVVGMADRGPNYHRNPFCYLQIG